MPEILAFAQIRAKHADYLRRTNTTSIPPELLTELQQFVEGVRLAGREIVDEDDREYLRGLLTFWGNWLYNMTRTYPNVNLEPFTAEAAAAHGREVAGKLLKGEAIGAGLRRRLLIGGLVLAIAVVFIGAAGLSGIGFVALRSPSATAVVAIAETSRSATTPTAVALLATDTASAAPAPTQTAAGPTSIVAGVTATPSPAFIIPVTGGGPNIEPIHIISVQLVEPSPGLANVTMGQPFSVGIAYANMQPGWRMFYILTQVDNAATLGLVAPGSLGIDSTKTSGIWTEKAEVGAAGDYEIGVFVATTTGAADALQQAARSGQPLPADFNLEGVITFAELAFVQAN